MKLRILTVIAAGTVILSLSACASMPGGGSSSADIIKAIQEIASDPRCGHIDRLQGNLGGLTGNNLSLFLERTCPAAPPVDPD